MIKVDPQELMLLIRKSHLKEACASADIARLDLLSPTTAHQQITVDNATAEGQKQTCKCKDHDKCMSHLFQPRQAI